MELTTFWFLLIGVLWAGYFLLEGFDFGVGILLPFVGRDDRSRRLAINTIGPVWDGNEVWLIVAGGATFAAFPEWYATLFSGFFLPLLIILVALIVRGLAFEYRGKRDTAAWKKRWDTAIFMCSLLPAILWGVAFGNILRGVPIDANHEYAGGFVNLLNPYALLGGLTTLTLFTLHGAVFLALKTDGPMREQSGQIAETMALVSVPIAAGFLVWTQITHADGWGIALSALAAIALLTVIPLTRRRREGWAFLATAATLLLAVAALFVTLFPNVMPSTIDPALSLTVDNTSSTPYTLRVMTWVAVFFTPIVVLYQSWTYWIFRKRLRLSDIPA